VDLLRQALNAKLEASENLRTTASPTPGRHRLEQLSDAQRRVASQLTAAAAVQLGTPETTGRPGRLRLDHWVSKTQALPSRFEAARHAAVQLLKPNVVHVALPKRTLNDEAELKAWLAEVEALLNTKLKMGLWPSTTNDREAR
jgi:hypothetical protein